MISVIRLLIFLNQYNFLYQWLELLAVSENGISDIGNCIRYIYIKNEFAISKIRMSNIENSNEWYKNSNCWYQSLNYWQQKLHLWHLEFELSQKVESMIAVKEVGDITNSNQWYQKFELAMFLNKSLYTIKIFEFKISVIVYIIEKILWMIYLNGLMILLLQFLYIIWDYSSSRRCNQYNFWYLQVICYI